MLWADAVLCEYPWVLVVIVQVLPDGCVKLAHIDMKLFMTHYTKTVEFGGLHGNID